MNNHIKNNQLGYFSEEYCSYCENAFETDTVLSNCPECGKQVVSCNACDEKNCFNCVDGKNFKNGKEN